MGTSWEARMESVGRQKEFKDVNSYVVEKLLPCGGLSVLMGKPKCGKSTLGRQLAMAVVKGTPFLGRSTTQGAVLYFAHEERRADVLEHFELLGAEVGDPLTTFYGAVDRATSVKELEAYVSTHPEIKLIVIDMLIHFMNIENLNDYNNTTNALSPLKALALKTGLHILLVTHTKKKESENHIDNALGSTGLAGAVDTVITLSSRGTSRIIQATVRSGEPILETSLNWNPAQKELSVGLLREEAEHQHREAANTKYEANVMKYLTDHPNSSRDQIMDSVTGQSNHIRDAIKRLVTNGVVRKSGGGDGGRTGAELLSLVELEIS